MCEALDLIPSTTNEGGEERKRKQEGDRSRGVRREGVVRQAGSGGRRDDSCRCP